MIIPNGHILLSLAGGGAQVDPATGYAQPETTAWGEPIPCQWRAVRQHSQGVVRGEHFTLARFDILIEADRGGLLDSDRLMLRRADGGEVGEFPIIAVEHLRAVRQLRITV